jgi:hypothetical protein
MAKSLRTMRDVANAHMARYHVLNLTNLTVLGGRHNTVEFRVFAGTTSALKITTYVMICLGLMERALDVTRLAPWDAKESTDKNDAFVNLGAGEKSLLGLLSFLGWTWSRGAVKMTGRKFGVIDGVDIRANVAEMRRLAKKFDDADPTVRAARRAQARAAVVESTVVPESAVVADESAPW